jgi:Bax protein
MRNNTITLLGAGLLFLVLTGTAVVATQAESPTEVAMTSAGAPKVVNADSAPELARLFDELGYQWPPRELASVPAVTLKALPHDFDSLPTEERKSLFLRSLLPIVLLENRRLQERRALASLLLSKEQLPAKNSATYIWLNNVAREMRVRGDLTAPETRQRLLRRLDEIPPVLALAQAAIESGWGTSRFAREGNSLFGQWTFQSDNGLEPSQRDDDANHFVQAFPNLQASVRAYMRNLNTSRAYREFRDSRAAMRAAGKDLSAEELASHLRRYSQRGMDYVRELQRIINSRSLAAFKPTPFELEQLAARWADMTVLDENT